MKNNHIVLIGFKHVGKSTIGKLLSEKLSLPLTDLDREMEKQHAQTSGTAASCREIYNTVGREKFRDLEHTVLQKSLLPKNRMVVSVGGGTAVDSRNQELLRAHTVILITSPKEAVYERIMLSGKPAFLSPDENTYDSFSKVWDEREKIHRGLAKITVANNGKTQEAVEQIMALLQEIV
ncbi:shikimate kinase [Candidatus Uhrbacteria bacterium]|nr:shikimate kinase [Candidatus Uhrbacteria bacterium]